MSDNRYLSLLRGINVGKAKRVAMADLRELMAELGFAQVTTLLNSGNVVFSAGRSQPRELAARIHQAVHQRTGVDCRVLVLSADQVLAIAEENSLVARAVNPSRLLVSVLADVADRPLLLPLLEQDWGDEVMRLGSHATYVISPMGVLDSKALPAIERCVGGRVTTRNWRTIAKLVALL